jgi:hypothetical protein
MLHRAAPLTLALLLLPAPGLAQDAPAPSEPAKAAPTAIGKGIEDHLAQLIETARQSSQDRHRYNLETLSCGEFEQLAASEQTADQSVISLLMVWAHGYQSGLQGIDFEARPVSLEGLVALTRKTLAECEQHPEVLFHIALGRID